MKDWVILHTHSDFSKQLMQVLGSSVAWCQDAYGLVNYTEVSVSFKNQERHQWVLDGKIISDFQDKIIYQEVFYKFDKVLGCFYPEDHEYVRYSWQAYLIGLFSHARIVINAINPQNLSVSQYQFPRLHVLGYKAGLAVPDYKVGMLCEGDIISDSLWFYPFSRPVGDGVLSIENRPGSWVVVRFVRYDRGFMVCWPDMPIRVKNSLRSVVSTLNIQVGEAYFRVRDDWVFYGVYPQLKTPGCTEAQLKDIAECIRDIGRGGIQ